MASTEVMTQWPPAEVHKAQLAVRHNRPVPKVQISSTKKSPSETVLQTEKVTPSGRAPLFTRRRSLSQSSNRPQRESNEKVNVTQSPVSTRRQSTSEMLGMDVDQLKSKLLSGLQSTKKAAPRKSISNESPTRTQQTRPNTIKATHEQLKPSQAPQASPHISKPFGFQHLAKIEKSPRPELTIVDIAQASIAAFNFQAGSHDQKVKPQKRPPPLRPKRPEEHEIPRDLLSPRVGLPMLRQAKSAEVVGSPMASPTHAPQQTFAAPHTPRLASPQRSYSLPFVNLHNASSPSEPKSAGFEQRPSSLIPQSKHDEITSTEARSGMATTNALLEQVTEESEGTITPRPPRSLSRIQSSRPLDASAPPPSLSQYDDLEPFLPRISLLPSIMLPRPLSCGSDTLGDLSLRPFDIDIDVSQQQKVSEVVDEFDFTSSWDDDIVFAYNHGAEAHCDFDWLDLPNHANAVNCGSSESVVLQEVPINRGTRHEQSSSWASTAGSDYGPIHRSRLGRTSVPQRDSVPDLEDHVLSHSGSSSSLIVGTPEDQFGFMGTEPDIAASPDCERRSSDTFGFISPQLPPLGLKYELDTDQLFDDLMAGFSMKQRHNSMLPTLEPRTYHDPRQRYRSISSPSQVPQPPTSHPTAARSITISKQDIRASDASIFTTMKVCLDSSLTAQPATQVPAAGPTSSPISSKHRKSRSKTVGSEWPIVITRHSLEAPTSTTSSPRSSSDSETEEGKTIASPSKSSIAGSKNKSHRSSFSMHKKAASADGLPLSRHAFLTRSSTPARNLFASQAHPAKKETAVPATRMRRMTAL